MKAAFLILSAVNQHPTDTTNTLAQLQHQLKTLSHRFEQSPNALIEYSETALSEEQKQQLLPHTDLLAEFRPNDLLIKLKAERQATNNPIDSTSYHELLKIVALNWFLQNAHGSGLFKDINYVVVIESGANMNLDFIEFLNKPDIVEGKFFFKKALPNPAQSDKSHALMHYPTDLWAYSAGLTDELIDNIIDASENAYNQLADINTDNGPVGLGYELFKTINLSKVHFLI